jgi:hypothetical protein
VLVIRTVVASDPAVRASLVAAFGGPDAPDGVRSCVERGDIVSIAFDDAIARAEAIDDLITLESHFVAHFEPPDERELARAAERRDAGLE